MGDTTQLVQGTAQYTLKVDFKKIVKLKVRANTYAEFERNKEGHSTFKHIIHTDLKNP